MDEKISAVADMIAQAERVVVFTGAGVSTESGIPDFRSPGGIWTRFDPEDFTIDRFLTSAETRRKQWKVRVEGGLTKARPEPNRAHYAIAELEKMGKLTCVVTQNVDNLHQMAGNDPEKVFELHGNMKYIKCMGCSERYTADEMLAKHASDEEAPVCERCGGILKPDVVFFGEALPQGVFEQATYHASKCDLLIVVGSSLVVYPAAYVPITAKDAGARLVIINLSSTPYDRRADVLINASAGEVMERILGEVRGRI
ncbi:MAG: NAD-dependent deacylase [Deltaproteobacteria bacterium]|nr:NAD-dependent deacylase [Deltaproteobacteria bacterium]